MKIRIKETQKIKDLTIIGENGIEWTADLITASDFWNDETEEHEMTQDDFEWWENWIEQDDKDQQEIKDFAYKNDIDIDIIKDKINEYYTELSNQHETIQFVLKELREEYSL